MRGLLDALFQFLQFGAFLDIAEFFLDRLDLFVQVVLALALFHLALDAATDALFHLQDVEFAFQQAEQMFQALVDADHLQHFLLLFQLQRQVRDDGVGQAAGLVDARQRREDFRRNFLVEFDVLVELRQQGAAHGFHFHQFLAFRGQDFGTRGKVGCGVGHIQHAGTLIAFHQHLDCAIGQFQHLQDGGHAAGIVEIFRCGVVLCGGLLRDQQYALAGFHRGFQRLDGFGAADKQGNDHVGEHHHIPKRQQRKIDLFLGYVVAHHDFLVRVEERMRGISTTLIQSWGA